MGRKKLRPIYNINTSSTSARRKAIKGKKTGVKFGLMSGDRTDILDGNSIVYILKASPHFKCHSNQFDVS